MWGHCTRCWNWLPDLTVADDPEDCAPLYPLPLGDCCVQMLQDRQQTERGVEGIPRPSMPIGHRLTGEIRNAFMSLWQGMHLRTLAEEGYRIGTRDQKCSLVIKKVNLITMKVPDLGDWISVQLQVKLDRDFNITVPAVPCVRRNVLSYMNHKKQTIDYLANNHNPCGVLVTTATIMSHQLDKLFFTPAHRWKCFFIRELRAGWKETLVVSAGQVGHWNPVLFHEHRNAAEKRPFPMQDIREVFCQLLGLENVPDLNKAMIQRFREVLADHFPEGQSARDHVENCLLCTRSLAKGSLAHRVCQMMGFEGDASHSCLLRLRAVTVLCRMRHQAVTVLCQMPHQEKWFPLRDPQVPEVDHLGAYLANVFKQGLSELAKNLGQKEGLSNEDALEELATRMLLRNFSKKLNRVREESKTGTRKAGMPTRQPGLNSNAVACQLLQPFQHDQKRSRAGQSCHGSLEHPEHAPLAFEASYSLPFSKRARACLPKLLGQVVLKSGHVLQPLSPLEAVDVIEVQVEGVPCYSFPATLHSATLASQLYLGLNQMLREDERLNPSLEMDQTLRLMIAYLGIEVRVQAVDSRPSEEQRPNMVNFLPTHSRLTKAHWTLSQEHPDVPSNAPPSCRGECLEFALRGQISYLDDDTILALKQGSAVLREGQNMAGVGELTTSLQEGKIDLFFRPLIPSTFTNASSFASDSGRRGDANSKKPEEDSPYEPKPFEDVWEEPLPQTLPDELFMPRSPRRSHSPGAVGPKPSEAGKATFTPTRLDAFGDPHQSFAAPIRLDSSSRFDLDSTSCLPSPQSLWRQIIVIKLADKIDLNGVISQGALPSLLSGAVLAFRKPKSHQKITCKRGVPAVRVSGQHLTIIRIDKKKRWLYCVVKENHSEKARPCGNYTTKKGFLGTSKSVHHSTACLNGFSNLGHGSVYSINVTSPAGRNCCLREFIAGSCLRRGWRLSLLGQLPAEVQKHVGMYLVVRGLHRVFVTSDHFGRPVRETTALLPHTLRDPKPREHRQRGPHRLEPYPMHAVHQNELENGLIPAPGGGWVSAREHVQQRLFALKGIHVPVTVFPQEIQHRRRPITMHHCRMPLFFTPTLPEEKPLSDLFDIETLKYGRRVEVTIKSLGQPWMDLLLCADNCGAQVIANTSRYAERKWSNFRVKPGANFLGNQARQIKDRAWMFIQGLERYLAESRSTPGQVVLLPGESPSDAQRALQEAMKMCPSSKPKAPEVHISKTAAGLSVVILGHDRLSQKMLDLAAYEFKLPAVVAADEQYLVPLEGPDENCTTSGFIINAKLATLSGTSWHERFLHEHRRCYGLLRSRPDGYWPQSKLQLLVVPAVDSTTTVGLRTRVTRRWLHKDAYLLESQHKDLIGIETQELLEAAQSFLRRPIKQDTREYKFWKVDGSGYEHLESLSPEEAQTTRPLPLLLLVTVGASSSAAFKTSRKDDSVVQFHPKNLLHMQQEIQARPELDQRQTLTRQLEHMQQRCPRRVLSPLVRKLTLRLQEQDQALTLTDVEDLARELSPERLADCNGCGLCAEAVRMVDLRYSSADPAWWTEAVQNGAIDYNSAVSTTELPDDLSELDELPPLFSLTPRSKHDMSFLVDQAEQHVEVTDVMLGQRLLAGFRRLLVVAATKIRDMQTKISATA